MDVRILFAQISQQLRLEFDKSSQVSHSGGKGTLREDAFAKFLEDYLPNRYAVGRGEVVSSRNEVSGQLDAVIYDPSHCPVLLKSSSHAVFPIESVFGVVSIKSTLDSTQLRDAYQNIASAKRLVDPRGFQASPASGMAVGMAAPQIVGVVFAYQAGRSLDAVATQVRALDDELGDERHLRPDFVVVLGEGIVGPRVQIRTEFNFCKWPKTPEDYCAQRATRRHTLLRAYLQLLAELNALTLRDLDLQDYLKMPMRLGNFLVTRNRFIRYPTDGDVRDGKVMRISKEGIAKIVSHCEQTGKITMRQHLLNTVGSIPEGMTEGYLGATIFEFNPKGLPPIDLSAIRLDSKGRPGIPQEYFQATPLQIDGEHYAVHMGSLEDDEFEEDPDMDVEEMLSE
jgi:hypothetical protein